MEKLSSFGSDSPATITPDNVDLENQDAQRQRLTFAPDFVPTDRLDGTNARERRGSRRLSRSQSRRDSISSARGRAMSTSAGVPIGYRTLSFAVANSQAKQEHHPKKKHHNIFHHEKKPKAEDRKAGDVKNQIDADHFEKLDFHILDKSKVLSSTDTPEGGLSTSEAASRLARDGKNTLPQRRENYLKKLFCNYFPT
jgi:sodium/potassium-transporting ATPase subunit alpha